MKGKIMEDVLFAESLFNIDKESLSVKGFKIFKRFTRNDGKANRMNEYSRSNESEKSC